MNASPQATIVVDRLTPVSLVQLVPLMLKGLRRGSGKVVVRYFTLSNGGRRLLGMLRGLGWLEAVRLEYAYEQVRDEHGGAVGMRVEYGDTLQVCGEIRQQFFETNRFIKLMGKRFDSQRLCLYLEKFLAAELAPLLFRINVVSWFHHVHSDGNGTAPQFVTAAVPWRRPLESYAASKGVRLRWVRTVSWHMPWQRVMTLGRRVLQALLTRRQAHPQKVETSHGQGAYPVTVAMPFACKGVTLDLSRNTDLFWQPFASLQPEQLLIFFTHTEDQLGRERYELLRRTSIRAVAMSAASRSSPDLPLWQPTPSLSVLLSEAWRLRRFLLAVCFLGGFCSGASRWIIGKLYRFVPHYLYWREFFTCFHVKVYVDHNDWEKERLAADQALEDLGGISVSYQRSDELLPSVHRASSVDVQFAFSPTCAETERQSRSMVRHFVGTGYIHDHAFARVRERADNLRRQLERHGARFIICFLGQSSSEDPAVGYSHAFQAKSYRFLIERLLADSSLGLILKPKKPRALRQTLGPWAGLLEEARATGRCVLFEEGIATTPVLPCEASQTADVAIGLVGAVAAFESALSGTPTLLIDREGWRTHPWHSYGLQATIFSDWESLWQTLEAYRKNPAGVPGFGFWGCALTEMDPFRDGRAAERIGVYIGWLAEGLGRGLSRDAVLAAARERYVHRWGDAMVVDLRTAPPPLRCDEDLNLRQLSTPVPETVQL